MIVSSWLFAAPSVFSNIWDILFWQTSLAEWMPFDISKNDKGHWGGW